MNIIFKKKGKENNNKETKVMKSFPMLDEGQLKKLGAYHTAVEISGQPQLWLKTYLYLFNIRHSLQKFLEPILSKPDLQVIFTGAGTSAYIGDVLQSVFQKNTGLVARSIATTDVVTHPEYFFIKKVPTLLVSFARSGNSPESVKAVELANEMCEEVYHLIITCNPEGELAQKAGRANYFVFLLPPESNDQSLAMTGSFSSMLMSGILISRLNELEAMQAQVRLAAHYGQIILNNYARSLKEAAELNFDRAVFLGSGLFQGIARESHLKLQELTDGRVICKFDTFLGFRHGPKAVINDRTLMVYIFSNNPYARLYERDLVRSIYKGQKGVLGIGIAEHSLPEVETELQIVLSDENGYLDEAFLAPVSVLPAQILGFYKSLHFNLKPDSPSESGTITRVVQGVTLYPFSEQSV